jgi:hypothetical protein
MQLLLNYCQLVKGTGKVHPTTCHEIPEGENRYSSTLSLTSMLDGSGWLAPRPGRFTRWKETRYPLYRRLRAPQGWSGRARKSSSLAGFDPRTIQHVAIRCSNWPIASHTVSLCCEKGMESFFLSLEENLEIFTVLQKFQNFYLFIPWFLAEFLTIFCQTLVVRHRFRHLVI